MLWVEMLLLDNKAKTHSTQTHSIWASNNDSHVLDGFTYYYFPNPTMCKLLRELTRVQTWLRRIKGMKHDWTLQILWFGISDTCVLGFLEVPKCLYVCTYKRMGHRWLDPIRQTLPGWESSSQIGQAWSTWHNQPPISRSLALRVAMHLPSRPTQSPMIECRLFYLATQNNGWWQNCCLKLNTMCEWYLQYSLYVHFVDVHVP